VRVVPLAPAGHENGARDGRTLARVRAETRGVPGVRGQIALDVSLHVGARGAQVGQVVHVDVVRPRRDDPLERAGAAPALGFLPPNPQPVHDVPVPEL